MDYLPIEILYFIAMKLPFTGLKSLCQINYKLSTIYHDDIFWKQKY